MAFFVIKVLSSQKIKEIGLAFFPTHLPCIEVSCFQWQPYLIIAVHMYASLSSALITLQHEDRDRRHLLCYSFFLVLSAGQVRDYVLGHSQVLNLLLFEVMVSFARC